VRSIKKRKKCGINQRKKKMKEEYFYNKLGKNIRNSKKSRKFYLLDQKN
jgi:hypothetical protein